MEANDSWLLNMSKKRMISDFNELLFSDIEVEDWLLTNCYEKTIGSRWRSGIFLNFSCRLFFYQDKFHSLWFYDYVSNIRRLFRDIKKHLVFLFQIF